jgi:hypothetical protein
MNSEALAVALDRIAEALAANPSPIIGLKVVATNDGKGGDVTGMRVSAVGFGSGDVTGLKVTVTDSGRNPVDEGLIQELKSAAAAVRAGNAPKSWIDSLLRRATDLGNQALDAVVAAAAKAATGLP